MQEFGINMKHWVLRQLNEGLFYPLYDYCRHERVTAEEQDAIVEWLRKKMAANSGESFTEAKSCISALELNPNIELSEEVCLYLSEYAPQEIFGPHFPPQMELLAFKSMSTDTHLDVWGALVNYINQFGLSKETENFLFEEYKKIGGSPDNRRAALLYTLIDAISKYKINNLVLTEDEASNS